MAGGNAFFANENVTMVGGNAAFAGEDVPFTDGNAAARTFGRAHRRRPYHSNTCRHSAEVKTKILMLAVTLQALKRENIVSALHGDDKMAKILFPRCTVTIKWHKYCSRAAR